MRSLKWFSLVVILITAFTPVALGQYWDSYYYEDYYYEDFYWEEEWYDSWDYGHSSYGPVSYLPFPIGNCNIEFDD